MFVSVFVYMCADVSEKSDKSDGNYLKTESTFISCLKTESTFINCLKTELTFVEVFYILSRNKGGIL